MSHQSSLLGTSLCRDVIHDERREYTSWMLKTRQTGFLCFNSCCLHVPILRGKMFFMVQFLFKLELDMSVKGARGSGFNFEHFPSTWMPNPKGHEPSGYMSPCCWWPGQCLGQWLSSGIFGTTGTGKGIQLGIIGLGGVFHSLQSLHF